MPLPFNIIEAENVTFGYTDKLFLKNVSFKIEHGDYAAIIGDNGSGKSTMVKLILGLISPVSGSIRVRGEKVSNKQDYSKIGYVPQNSADSIARFPATAEEIVLSSLYKEIGPFRFATKKHRQIAHDALEQVGLLDYRKAMPPEMSGGQRQRLMLARVLACRPDILILDEPTVGIDADAVQQLLNILHQVNISKHVTILMVTHDIARIAPYANRVLCLSEKHFSENDLPAGTIVHAHPLHNDHHYEHVHCANCPQSHDEADCRVCQNLSTKEDV